MENNQNYIRPIYNYFIESSDYNGIPIEELFSQWEVDWANGIKKLIELIVNGDCIIQSSTLPYIIRETIPTVEFSVNYLTKIMNGKDDIFSQFRECIYPSHSYLLKHRDVSNIPPYEKYLALGGAHLQPLFFDLNVINTYLDDPRYKLKLRDYYGTLSYELINSTKIDKAGYYELNSFGLGYDENGIRVIVAFPRYLRHLSHSQQNVWEAHEITKPCKVIKSYWDNIMHGCWNFPQSLATGILNEREYVNKLWKVIFNDNLFLNDYAIEDLPPYFSFLFIPTSRALGKFTHLMDKLFSDQLNTKHLRKLLNDGNEEFPSVTEHFEQNIGSLTALELWIDNIYHLKNGEKIGKEIVAPFKVIRKLRQPEAHKIEVSDIYNVDIYTKHTDILRDIYDALLKFRVMLGSHPKAINVKPPKYWSKEVHCI